MQFTMSSPSYKNTNEMPIKQTTMKVDKTKVKKSSKVSSKVEILNIELQAMKNELQVLKKELQAMKKELLKLKKLKPKQKKKSSKVSSKKSSKKSSKPYNHCQEVKKNKAEATYRIEIEYGEHEFDDDLHDYQMKYYDYYANGDPGNHQGCIKAENRLSDARMEIGYAKEYYDDFMKLVNKDLYLQLQKLEKDLTVRFVMDDEGSIYIRNPDFVPLCDDYDGLDAYNLYYKKEEMDKWNKKYFDTDSVQVSIPVGGIDVDGKLKLYKKLHPKLDKDYVLE